MLQTLHLNILLYLVAQDISEPEICFELTFVRSSEHWSAPLPRARPILIKNRKSNEMRHNEININNHMPLRLVVINQNLEWPRGRISPVRKKKPDQNYDSRLSSSN